MAAIESSDEKLPFGHYWICKMPDGVSCDYCSSRYMVPINGKRYCNSCNSLIVDAQNTSSLN